jgi:hypothetical protein
MEITMSELRRKVLDAVLTEEEKEKLDMSFDDEVWPKDEYYVPPRHVDMDDSEARGIRTRYTNPEEYDALFHMPNNVNDFACHECGGDYGPWVHSGFEINVDGGYNEKPIYANILHKRYRWCEDCGYEFFNCYAVGKVFFERTHSGSLEFKHESDG